MIEHMDCTGIHYLCEARIEDVCSIVFDQEYSIDNHPE